MKYAYIPVEILSASLTLRQLKVLCALYSFKKSKDTVEVWPSRKTLSNLTGLQEHKISATTSELERLGWLKKQGKGGMSKTVRYTLHVPESGTEPKSPESYPQTVPELGTVPESGTVPKSGTGGVPKSGTGGVPKSGNKWVPKLGTREDKKEHIDLKIKMKDSARAPAPAPARTYTRKAGGAEKPETECASVEVAQQHIRKMLTMLGRSQGWVERRRSQAEQAQTDGCENNAQAATDTPHAFGGLQQVKRGAM